MRNNVLFLLLAVAVSGLAVGCGSGNTAAEIAQSYGILNRCDLQPGIASLIQSGQADKMVENGQADIRMRVQGLGKDRILVTEYLVQGEVFRVEVRRSFNPIKGLPWYDVRYGKAQQGLKDQVISWGQLARVYNCLKDNSYLAQAEVAYRAWRGLDGKVHPVRVKMGIVPDWQSDSDGMNVYLRTTNWGMSATWVQGLTSDTRHGKEYDLKKQAFYFSEKKLQANDGRWLLLNSSTGEQKFNGQPVPFINLDLYSQIVDLPL